MPEKDKPFSEVRANAKPSRALLKARLGKRKYQEDSLLAGYYFPQIDAQLQPYKDIKYKELPNEGTGTEIKNIQSKLEGSEFKLSPILYNNEHWCCGVITHDRIYVFDSTLQTQRNKSKIEGILKIGDAECNVIYLNYKEQVQSNSGKICGPCVVEFSKKIANLKSIGDVLNVCNDGIIFKDVAQEIYNKLRNKASAEAQFTPKYYDMIDKGQREGEQVEHKE